MRQRSSNQSVFIRVHPRFKKKPRGSVERGAEIFAWKRERVYFAKRCFAACDFAREAAFLWTTPDFTALSIAEV